MFITLFKSYQLYIAKKLHIRLRRHLYLQHIQNNIHLVARLGAIKTISYCYVGIFDIYLCHDNLVYFDQV